MGGSDFHDIRKRGLTVTAGVLGAKGLKRLAPERLSRALLGLIGERTPMRAILRAGEGHFAAANITLAHGAYVGTAAHAGEQVDVDATATWILQDRGL